MSVLTQRHDIIKKTALIENIIPEQVVLLNLSQYESQLRILLYKSTTLSKMGVPHLMMVSSIIGLHSPFQIPEGQAR